jgi:hypothetical protein
MGTSWNMSLQEKYFILLAVWFKCSERFTGNSVVEKVQVDQQDIVTPERYWEALEYFLPFPHSICSLRGNVLPVVWGTTTYNECNAFHTIVFSCPETTMYTLIKQRHLSLTSAANFNATCSTVGPTIPPFYWTDWPRFQQGTYWLLCQPLQ